MLNNVSGFVASFDEYEQMPKLYMSIHDPWIEDIYGKMIPVRPSYPTLDGLPVDEYNSVPKPRQVLLVPYTVTHAVINDRGSFYVTYRCYTCDIVTNFDMCRCCGTPLNPELVEKSTS